MVVFDGAKLASCRKAAGYTQKALGEAIGTSESHVQFWEYNRKQPTASYLLRIMLLLHCSAADLVSNDPA